MKHLLLRSLLAVAVTTAPATVSAAVIGDLSLRRTAVPNGAAGSGDMAPLLADIYSFTLTSEDGNITSLNLTFTGNLVNEGPDGGLGTVTFRDDPAIPQVITFEFPESFFVVPTGQTTNVLSVDTLDNNSSLASAYTLQGGGILVNQNNPTIVATLSVATGDAAPVFAGGQAVVNGNLVDIVPEPTTALCLLLTLGLIRQRPVRPLLRTLTRPHSLLR